MRNWKNAVVLGSLLCCMQTMTAQGVNPFDQGMIYFRKRAEGSAGLTGRPENINEAIRWFRMALFDPRFEKEATVYLLKSYYFKGTFVAPDLESRIGVFLEGKQLGEKMAAKYPRSADVQFWYAANMGKWAEAKGSWASARDGVVEKMKAAAEASISADPLYHDASATRTLGVLHFKVPYIPFLFSWPDEDEGIRCLEKCVTMGPYNPGNYVSYAEGLHEIGLLQKAIDVLKRAVNLRARPEMLLEDQKEIEDAKALLQAYSRE